MKGHAKLGGRRPGAPNKVPRDVKTVMRLLAEGTMTLDGRVVAHLVAEKLVQGLEAPVDEALPYVKLALEYGVGKPKPQEGDTGGGRGIQIVFTTPPHDPLARPGEPPRPLRILGQQGLPGAESLNLPTGRKPAQKSGPKGS